MNSFGHITVTVDEIYTDVLSIGQEKMEMHHLVQTKLPYNQ